MPFDIDKYMGQIDNGELVSENVVQLICMKVGEILMKEKNNIALQSPLTIVGDVHGYELM